MVSHMSGIFSDEANHHGMISKQIPRNIRVRKCKVCGMRLSEYNNNPACFVHMSKYRDMEDIKREKQEDKKRRDSDVARRHREKLKRTVRVQKDK